MRVLPDRFRAPRHEADLQNCLSQGEVRARSYAQDYIGVEHVFLSIRDLPSHHPVAMVISRLPTDVDAFWHQLEREAKVFLTKRALPRILPPTPRLRHVLGIAFRLAKSSGTREVSLYHFVVAVAREHTSLVAQVFRDQLWKQGGLLSYEEAAAQLWTLAMTFPDQALFTLQARPNLALDPAARKVAVQP